VNNPGELNELNVFIFPLMACFVKISYFLQHENSSILAKKTCLIQITQKLTMEI